MKPLVWTHNVNFSVYGARIGVRSNDARALEELQTIFPPHWRLVTTRNVDWQYSLFIAPPTRSGRKPIHRLWSNEEQRIRSKDLEQIFIAFDQDVQLAIAQKARGKVFVHAGAVGWRGRGIIIPGKSYAGKSTLVRELVRAGATYYSDEFAVLDQQGRLHPFARQPALRDENNLNQKISLTELGGAIGQRPLPVGTVLATKYRERAKWRPRVLTPGLGVLELLAHTVAAPSRRPMVLEILTRVSKQAIVLKSARGDARALAEQLLDTLS